MKLFHHRGAEHTELLFYIFLFADPGGIGSAFHRAEDGEKENAITLRGFSRLLELSCNIYYGQLSFKLQRQLLIGFPSLPSQQRWKEEPSQRTL